MKETTLMRVRIVVADQSEARFYDTEGLHGPLQPAGQLSDPKARLHDRDLESDRPGRVFDHAPLAAGRRGAVGHHGTEGERSPRKHEAVNFARQIADQLHDGSLVAHVEIRQGLVHQQKTRAADERLGEEQPLLLASRDTAQRVIRVSGGADGLDRCLGRGRGLRPAAKADAPKPRVRRTPAGRMLASSVAKTVEKPAATAKSPGKQTPPRRK